MQYSWASWIYSVTEVALPVLGGMIIVLSLEFFIQKKDNSWNVFKKSAGRNVDIFSMTLVTLLKFILMSMFILANGAFRKW